MRSLALDYEDSTHTLYSVTVVGISLHIFTATVELYYASNFQNSLYRANNIDKIVYYGGNY